MRETCEFASVLAAESIGVPDVHVACFLAVLNEHDFDLYEPLARLRRSSASRRRAATARASRT